MIVIIDFGIGNHFSILKIFQKLRVACELSGDPETIRRAGRLVLPGVGNFETCMRAFDGSGLRPVVEEAALGRGVPLLGICVGMQMLTSHSEEGDCPGLNWIPGRTRRFPAEVDGQALRVPHVGWNAVSGEGPLFAGLPADARFYFTHSYYVDCDEAAMVAGRTHYGLSFASAVRHGNLHGVQFHPEKSHADGMALLGNFAEAG